MAVRPSKIHLHQSPTFPTIEIESTSLREQSDLTQTFFTSSRSCSLQRTCFRFLDTYHRRSKEGMALSRISLSFPRAALPHANKAWVNLPRLLPYARSYPFIGYRNFRKIRPDPIYTTDSARAQSTVAAFPTPKTSSRSCS